MHLVDLHVPSSRRSLELDPDLRSLAAHRPSALQRVTYATAPPGQAALGLNGENVLMHTRELTRGHFDHVKLEFRPQRWSDHMSRPHAVNGFRPMPIGFFDCFLAYRIRKGRIV